MDDLVKLVSIKKKAVNGLFLLIVRRFLGQIILTGGNIILARILFPSDFGTLSILTGIIGLLSIFANLGLETALVQKKEEPTKEQLQTVFTISFLLSLLVFLILFIIAPLPVTVYQNDLPEKSIFYFRILAFSLVFLNLRGISAAMLERNLDYSRILIGEISETFILQIITVILAIKGFGVISFVWGTLLSRLLTFIIFFLLYPWPIGFKLKLPTIKKILPFGINFQLNTVIGGLNGSAMTIFMGKVTGTTGVGLVNWAGGLAVVPRMIPEILCRLIFPVSSRVQDNKKLLGKIIEKSTQLVCLIAFPQIVILTTLVYPSTRIIYTEKWLAGIPSFYFFSLQSIFQVIGGVLIQGLLAIGEAKIVRNINLFSTILLWILTIPLVFKFGFTGLAVASFLVSSTFFLSLLTLRKKITFNLWLHIWPYFVYSIIVGGLSLLINQLYQIRTIIDLILIAIIDGLVYLILILIFKKQEIIEDINKIKNIIF